MSRLRECEGKKGYRRKKEAQDFAFMLKRRYLDFATVYRCKHCDLYHLGHPRSRRRYR